MLNKDRASRAQLFLGKLARIEPIDIARINRIGAVDVAYEKDIGCTVYVESDFPSIKNVSIAKGFYPVKIEYVSTYLAFREAPPILNLMLNKVRRLPHLLLVNGHGLAHPRHCGLATHIGVVLKVPTIGIARRSIGDPNSDFNRDFSSKLGRLHVSPGNMITLRQAMEIVSKLPLNHNYPEPLGTAHLIAKEELEDHKIN